MARARRSIIWLRSWKPSLCRLTGPPLARLSAGRAGLTQIGRQPRLPGEERVAFGFQPFEHRPVIRAGLLNQAGDGQNGAFDPA